MSIREVLFAISMGLDVFAGGLGLGIANLPRSRWIRTALIFSILGLVMLGIGVLLGRLLSDNFGHFASYVAGVALMVIGLRGTLSSGADAHAEKVDELPSSTSSIVMTGIAVSMDKLAIGVTLAVSDVAVVPLAAYLAVQGFILTLLGLYLGKRIGSRLGDAAHLLSGIVFILLGAF